MSYIAGTKKSCNGNTNGFIYALVRVNKKDACVDMLSYSDDTEYYLNNTGKSAFKKYLICVST